MRICVECVARALARQVQIHQHATQLITNTFVSDELNYDHYTVVSVSDDPLPLKWAECQPLMGKKLVTMTLQVESETHLSVLWGGNTWSFRQALDEFGVHGAYHEDDVETTNKDGNTKSGGRRYFRLLKSIDVTSPDASKIKSTIIDIFHSLAMKVFIEGAPVVEDSPVSEYIDVLKGLSNLHF